LFRIDVVAAAVMCYPNAGNIRIAVELSKTEIRRYQNTIYGTSGVVTAPFIARARSRSLVRRCLFVSSVMVRVSCRVRVRFNNSHLPRKSRTASYLAMRHICGHQAARRWLLRLTSYVCFVVSLGLPGTVVIEL